MASTAAQTTLSGKGTAGAGTTIDLTDAKSKVSFVLIPTGTITAGTVALQASQDNTNWVTLYVFDAKRSGNQFYSNINGAFRYWRGNVLTAVEGGTVTATLMEADR